MPSIWMPIGCPIHRIVTLKVNQRLWWPLKGFITQMIMVVNYLMAPLVFGPRPLGMVTHASLKLFKSNIKKWITYPPFKWLDLKHFALLKESLSTHLLV